MVIVIVVVIVMIVVGVAGFVLDWEQFSRTISRLGSRSAGLSLDSYYDLQYQYLGRSVRK